MYIIAIVAKSPRLSDWVWQLSEMIDSFFWVVHGDLGHAK